jgi:hypothetical protein
MGACMSSSVQEPVQKPVVERPIEERGIPAQPVQKPAKTLDWVSVRDKALCTPALVIGGSAVAAIGVPIAAFGLGIVTGIAAVKAALMIPFTIFDIILGNKVENIIDGWKEWWQLNVYGACFVYQVCIGDRLREIIWCLRDVWRMPIYR